MHNPLSIGVFESQKCYFVIFYKNEKTAISMWRGQNQDLLNFTEAVALFKKTSFRMIKNQTTGRANRSASTIMDVSNFKKKFDLSSPGVKANDKPAFGDLSSSL